MIWRLDQHPRSIGCPSQRFTDEVAKADQSRDARKRMPTSLKNWRSWTDSQVRMLDVLMRHYDYRQNHIEICGNQASNLARVARTTFISFMNKLSEWGIIQEKIQRKTSAMRNAVNIYIFAENLVIAWKNVLFRKTHVSPPSPAVPAEETSSQHHVQKNRVQTIGQNTKKLINDNISYVHIGEISCSAASDTSKRSSLPREQYDLLKAHNIDTTNSVDTQLGFQKTEIRNFCAFAEKLEGVSDIKFRNRVHGALLRIDLKLAEKYEKKRSSLFASLKIIKDRKMMFLNEDIFFEKGEKHGLKAIEAFLEAVLIRIYTPEKIKRNIMSYLIGTLKKKDIRPDLSLYKLIDETPALDEDLSPLQQRIADRAERGVEIAKEKRYIAGELTKQLSNKALSRLTVSLGINKAELEEKLTNWMKNRDFDPIALSDLNEFHWRKLLDWPEQPSFKKPLAYRQWRKDVSHRNLADEVMEYLNHPNVIELLNWEKR